MMMLTVLALGVTPSPAAAMFGGTDVAALTKDNFKAEVLDSQDTWLVNFYTPWSGEAKAIKDAFADAATALKGTAKVGAVDCDEDSDLANDYDVAGYPTLRLFSGGKAGKVVDAKTKDALVAAVGTPSPKKAGAKPDKKDKKAKKPKSTVVELTAENFDTLVIDSDKPWLVEFFAPWCGHCKKLKPEFDKLPKMVGDAAGIGTVDATVHGDLAKRYGVSGYPTIKFFNDDKANPEEYQGDRDAKSLAAFAKGEAPPPPPPPPPADYKEDGDVVVLTDANFKEKVIDSKDKWLVEFYAPWCGHCKNLKPDWEKLAAKVKDEDGVHVAALDATVHRDTAGKYSVGGFPTLLWFTGEDKSAEDFEPEKYEGPRGLDALYSHVMGLPPPEAEKPLNYDGTSVVVLTADNFEDEVMKSQDFWLIEFYAPWCGHCKNLKPEWIKAADSIKKAAKIAAVDATLHGELATKYGVKSYPTIKYLDLGDKDADASELPDFDGGRTADAIVDWVFGKLEAHGILPDLPQLVDQASFDECLKESVCVVLVTPHLIDTGAEGRKEMIGMMQKLSSAYRGKPASWLWVGGTDQPDFEAKFDLSYGYPALVAIANTKQRRAWHKGRWDEAAVKKTLNNVFSGFQPTVPFKAHPKISTTPAWDGGEYVEEEED